MNVSLLDRELFVSKNGDVIGLVDIHEECFEIL